MFEVLNLKFFCYCKFWYFDWVGIFLVFVVLMATLQSFVPNPNSLLNILSIKIYQFCVTTIDILIF